jgi:hypothetical protein
MVAPFAQEADFQSISLVIENTPVFVMWKTRPLSFTRPGGTPKVPNAAS